MQQLAIKQERARRACLHEHIGVAINMSNQIAVATIQQECSIGYGFRVYRIYRASIGLYIYICIYNQYTSSILIDAHYIHELSTI